jgi:glycosyltransferase involved in cell wall biosynthesis
MRIAIDYTLAKKHIGGMGVFVRNTIGELMKNDKENTYILIENPIKFDDRNLFTKLKSVIDEHIWYQTDIVSKLQNANIDIYYSPNPPVPFFLKKPLILTIADMAFYYEKNMPFFVKKYLYFNYLLAAKKAKKITTFSEFSKKDICKILKVKPSKVIVIPLAASDNFVPSEDIKSIKKTLGKFSIKKDFILCAPGTFSARKNVSDLVLSVSNLPNKYKQNIQIVLVGKNSGSGFEDLKKYVDELKMADKVIFTGYIKPESTDLINIYTAAKLFVYPSLYEGFGLPPIEAMKMLTPVIVYNRTSLPEVVKDAGIIVNNHMELTNAITRLLKNRKLCQKLVRSGKKRASNYSWMSSAEMFRKLISSV